MLRVAPILIELAVLVYSLIDVIQTPAGEVRKLPKVAWMLLIVVIPLIGGGAWLLAGRPVRGAAGQVAWPPSTKAGLPEHERPLGPDDDPDFLREMTRGTDEQDRLLARWEEELRRVDHDDQPPPDERRDDGPDASTTPST